MLVQKTRNLQRINWIGNKMVSSHVTFHINSYVIKHKICQYIQYSQSSRYTPAAEFFHKRKTAYFIQERLYSISHFYCQIVKFRTTAAILLKLL